MNSVEESKKDKKVTTVRTKERDQRPKFTFKEAKEYDEIGGVIENLENKVSSIEKEMEKNSSSYSMLEALMTEKNNIEEELLVKYERYEYLEELAKRIEEYKIANSK